MPWSPKTLETSWKMCGLKQQIKAWVISFGTFTGVLNFRVTFMCAYNVVKLLRTQILYLEKFWEFCVFRLWEAQENGAKMPVQTLMSVIG